MNIYKYICRIFFSKIIF